MRAIQHEERQGQLFASRVLAERIATSATKSLNAAARSDAPTTNGVPEEFSPKP